MIRQYSSTLKDVADISVSNKDRSSRSGKPGRQEAGSPVNKSSTGKIELSKLSKAHSVARFNNAARVALVQCWDVVRRSGFLDNCEEDFVEFMEREGVEQAGLKLLETVVKINAYRQDLAQELEDQQQIETMHLDEMTVIDVD